MFFPKQACPVGVLAACLGIGERCAGGWVVGAGSRTVCFTVLCASYRRHSAVEGSVAAV